MPANTTPIFTLTPVIGVANLSVANTARDGSGTVAPLITGGTNGTRISRIRVQTSGSNVNWGMVRLFLTTGSVTSLYDEIAITSASPTNSATGYDYALELVGERALTLPSGVILKASTSMGDPINVFAEGGDY